MWADRRAAVSAPKAFSPHIPVSKKTLSCGRTSRLILEDKRGQGKEASPRRTGASQCRARSS